MNSIHFFISVAILSVCTFHQNVHASPSAVRDRIKRSPISYGTLQDVNNTYKHEAFVRSSERLCSGSIISDTHVLTAAHCVVEVNSSDVIQDLITVTVGITDIYKDSTGLQTIRLVESVFLDTAYSFDNVKTRYHAWYGDIAVLKLNERLGLGQNSRIAKLNIPHYVNIYTTENQEPIEYRYLNYYSNSSLKYTGLGITGYKQVYNPTSGKLEPKPEYAKYLHSSIARTFPIDRCIHDLPTNDPNIFVPDPTAGFKICAQLTHRRKSTTCEGDSGAPLYDENTMEVIGVLSFAPPNCNQTGLTTFTKVVTFTEWIEPAMKGLTTNSSKVYSFRDNQYYRYMAELHREPKYKHIRLW